MKSKNFFVTTLALLGFSTVCNAQMEETYPANMCRADIENRIAMKAIPTKPKKNLSKAAKERLKAQRPEKYVIPVVFHVFGNDFQGKKVTYDLIADALKKTNEDYNCLTKGSMPSGDRNKKFDALNTPLPIEFRLAEIGDKGQTTSGVVYHPLEKGFGHYNAPRMRRYAWDNKKYMNVYIMLDLYDDGDHYNSGVSWYPNEYMTENNLARVVYNGAYLGTNTDENMRRVLTHEFGHFLNLAHTFDYDTSIFPDGCQDGPNGEVNHGDYVDDTPRADRPFMSAADKNCLGERTNWTNYMNYSRVRTSMFTKGQVERMLDALDSPARRTLWAEENQKEVFLKDNTTPRLVLTNKKEQCAKTRDGEFDVTYAFYLVNGQLQNRELEEGTDFTLDGMPEGFTATAKTQGRYVLLNIKGNRSISFKRFSVKFNQSIMEEGKLYECSQPLVLEKYNQEEVTAIEEAPKAEEKTFEIRNANIITNGQLNGIISVYGPDGMLSLKRHVSSTENNVSLEMLPKGIYILKIQPKDGKIITQKLYR